MKGKTPHDFLLQVKKTDMRHQKKAKQILRCVCVCVDKELLNHSEVLSVGIPEATMKSLI